jgi:hypothetical protein
VRGTWSPPSLVEKLISGSDIKVTKGAWRVPKWRVKWCSWDRLGDREAILLCECFNNVD